MLDMRHAASLSLLLVAIALPARAQTVPFFQSPLGPMIDVTDDWQAYQPATDFCIKPDVFDPTDQLVSPFMPLNDEWRATADGTDPVCAAAGFAPTDTGLYHGHVETPILCPGCRRIFLDYSAIPANDPASLLFYAHGHAYFRVSSFNPSYSIDPLSHSPNVKNFTNDKLVAPSGSTQEMIAHGIDTYDMSYVGDTAHYAHTASQGAYYVGPTYLSAGGPRRGAYVDVNVGAAAPLPNPNLNAIHYEAGFNSGEATCLDNDFDGYHDANFFYGGCVDHFGFSDPAQAIDPFADE
jgi:hypothetical protein